MHQRFVIDRGDAKLLGVGSGIARYFDVDPLLVRLGLVAGLFVLGPVMILLYLLTAWLAPSA